MSQKPSPCGSSAGQADCSLPASLCGEAAPPACPPSIEGALDLRVSLESCRENPDSRWQDILSDPGWPSFPNCMSPLLVTSVCRGSGVGFVCAGEVLTRACVSQSSDLKQHLAPWSLSVSEVFLGSSLPCLRCCLREESVGRQPPPSGCRCSVADRVDRIRLVAVFLSSAACLALGHRCWGLNAVSWSVPKIGPG